MALLAEEKFQETTDEIRDARGHLKSAEHQVYLAEELLKTKQGELEEAKERLKKARAFLKFLRAYKKGQLNPEYYRKKGESQEGWKNRILTRFGKDYFENPDIFIKGKGEEMFKESETENDSTRDLRNSLGIEIPVHVPITEEQRAAAKKAFEAAYDKNDRIDNAYIDIESTSGRPALFVTVNKGNIGSGALNEIIGLR